MSRKKQCSVSLVCSTLQCTPGTDTSSSTTTTSTMANSSSTTSSTGTNNTSTNHPAQPSAPTQRPAQPAPAPPAAVPPPAPAPHAGICSVHVSMYAQDSKIYSYILQSKKNVGTQVLVSTRVWNAYSCSIQHTNKHAYTSKLRECKH